MLRSRIHLPQSSESGMFHPVQYGFWHLPVHVAPPAAESIRDLGDLDETKDELTMELVKASLGGHPNPDLVQPASP